MNAGSQKARGIDFGLQYMWESPFGVFTSTTNVTYLDRFEFATVAGAKEIQLEGTTTDPFSSNDGFLVWRGKSRLDWTWNNLNINTTCTYTGGFEDFTPFNVDGVFDHYVKATWVFDGQASYEFTFPAPVESTPVAGYSKGGKEVVRGKDGKMVETAESQTATYSMPCWQKLLDKTKLIIGCNNIFGQDPPDSFGFGGNTTGYPGFLYDATGRFVYVGITKKF